MTSNNSTINTVKKSKNLKLPIQEAFNKLIKKSKQRNISFKFSKRITLKAPISKKIDLLQITNYRQDKSQTIIKSKMNLKNKNLKHQQFNNKKINKFKNLRYKQINLIFQTGKNKLKLKNKNKKLIVLKFLKLKILKIKFLKNKKKNHILWFLTDFSLVKHLMLNIQKSINYYQQFNPKQEKAKFLKPSSFTNLISKIQLPSILMSMESRTSSSLSKPKRMSLVPSQPQKYNPSTKSHLIQKPSSSHSAIKMKSSVLTRKRTPNH